MTSAKMKNIPHSIFERLLDQARSEREDFNVLLSRYSMERYLYRLGISSYSNDFILKGASLFLVWTGRNHRVTRDADLLSITTMGTDQIRALFVEICNQQPPIDDGMVYLQESVKVIPIREDQAYDGVRITLLSLLHQAKIPLQIDIGFGDVVTPAAERVVYPAILEGPNPRLRAYPVYTVISEKLEAMVHLGMANSRMKDFHDIAVLTRTFEFDGDTLREAIRNTFKRRRTPIPEGIPVALSPTFALDEQKQSQWRTFLTRSRPADVSGELYDVIEELRDFLLPILVRLEESTNIDMVWYPDAGWETRR